jgi:UPF0176 protein
MSEKFVVTTFYKFVALLDFEDRRVKFIKFCNDHKIKGTILLAKEGVNATLTGTREAIDEFYKFITSMSEFSDMEFKESFSDYMPFSKMKVRLKPEIVRLKIKDLDMSKVGEYLDAKEWDDLISKKETILIDTRNDYEVIFGTFKNARNPKTRNFSDLPEWVERNLRGVDKETPIAMFCTGGIRCEKSTAFMKHVGFKNVYHLKGGILKYLEDTQGRENMWQGRCFVFDDRVAVDSELDAYCK